MSALLDWTFFDWPWSSHFIRDLSVVRRPLHSNAHTTPIPPARYWHWWHVCDSPLTNQHTPRHEDWVSAILMPPNTYLPGNGFRCQIIRCRDIRIRFGWTMKHAGVAITMTSVTDLLAFGIGSSSTLLALSSFCVYAVWHQMVHFTHWKKSNEWQNSFGQVCDILTPGRSILVRLLPIYWPFVIVVGW